MFSGIININEYELIESIGSGSYSKVYKIEKKGTEEIFAAKVIKTKGSFEFHDLKVELSIMIKLNHPSVIKYIGFSPIDLKKKWRPVIVTEYLPNSSLETILKLARTSESPPAWNDTKKLINLYGVASAMAYLHANNIIHRDLKPDNILMDEYLFPRVADFGISKDIESTMTQSVLEFKGTPKYMAPEIWRTYNYSFKSDVYAFGLIMYEIITNKTFFEKLHSFQILAQLSAQYRPFIDDNVSESYRKLIEKCWSEKLDERPTFSEIIQLFETDPSFITESIDEKEFRDYVSMLKSCQSSIEDENALTKEEFMRKNSIEFNKIYMNPNGIDIESIEHETKTMSNATGSKDKSSSSIKMLADQGDAEAMIEYGEILMSGKEVEQNKEEAVNYFKKALDKGALKGMVLYADALFDGEGISQDKEEAAKLYKIASERGSIESAIKYADMLFIGDGVEMNKTVAIKIYKKAADKGDLSSVLKYADIVYNGDGIDQDKEEAIHLYKSAADNGVVDAMFKYAVILYQGEDVDEDKKEAARYFSIAANLGHTKSMLNLAYMMYRGDGIEVNKVESLNYFQICSDEGNVDAMNNCGIIKMQSEDFLEAANYFKKASELGSIEAMNNYATCLYQGKGVEKDVNLAISLYKNAAENGDEEAMNNYANFLLKGEEVTKNEALAFEYFKKAAEKGNIFAVYNYAKMINEGKFEKYNREKIMKLLKYAADKEHSHAALIYAQMMFDDGNKAQKYFKISADLNNADSLYMYGKGLYLGEFGKTKKASGYDHLVKACENESKNASIFMTIDILSKSCNIA